MRLVCPNCDAMYEVPDSVIPPEGRDVQCSNCGKAWFFNPNRTPVAEADIEEAIDTPPAPPQQEAEPAASPAPRTAPAPQPTPTPPEPPQPEVAADPEPEMERPAPRRRPLDDSVTDVLREEAAFEARARAEDAALEYQDDLPLEEPPESPGRDPLVEAELTSSDAASSRRDLLPDIDEINSTLRAASERATPEVNAAAVAQVISKRRQGFRTGFGLALIILAVFTFAYTTSDAISERAPGMAPMLDNYVSIVNAGRGWLEDAVEGLVQRMGT